MAQLSTTATEKLNKDKAKIDFAYFVSHYLVNSITNKRFLWIPSHRQLKKFIKLKDKKYEQ